MSWFRWTRNGERTAWHNSPSKGWLWNGTSAGPSRTALCGREILPGILDLEQHDSPDENEQCKTCRRVAQLAEPAIDNREVEGSSPSPPTTNQDLQSDGVLSFEELFDLYGLSRDEWEVSDRGSYIQCWDGKYNIRARIQRKQPAELCLEEILAEIREQAKQSYVPRPVPEASEAGVTILGLHDVHLGNLCEVEVTGEEQTLELSRQWIFNALDGLIAKTKGVTDTVVLPVGSDLFDVDAMSGATTRGTKQDTNAGPLRTFRFARKLMTDVILQLLDHWQRVEVYGVSGNHDYFTAFALNEVLDAQFSAEPRVQVTNVPKGRKYFRHGDCAFCATHGDKPKKSDMFSLFHYEAEQAGVNAGAKVRCALTGHNHRKSWEEEHGVIVRSFRALSGMNMWSYDQGYVGSPKAGEADIWAADGSWMNSVEVRV